MDPSQVDIVLVAQYVAAHKWLPLVALGIALVIRLLKDDTVLPTLPHQYRAWAAVGLGLASSVLQAVIGGTPWSQAVLHGLAAGLTAVLADNLLLKATGKEIPLPARLLQPAGDPPCNAGPPPASPPAS